MTGSPIDPNTLSDAEIAQHYQGALDEAVALVRRAIDLEKDQRGFILNKPVSAVFAGHDIDVMAAGCRLVRRALEQIQQQKKE